MITLNGHKIIPTIFPDHTSQVWKIEERVLEYVSKSLSCQVEWEFESEAEIMHLAQLKRLIDEYCDSVDLIIPFLPYGRQDKNVSNDRTFGLKVFADIINPMYFREVATVDAHSHWPSRLIVKFRDIFPKEAIENAIEETDPDVILFPDEGAKIRYENKIAMTAPKIFAEKTRDQSSGAITGVKIHGDVAGKIVLQCDDLCDGGATFTNIAKIAYEKGAKEVHLYVTHGLFTKGLVVLRDAGIKRIFTRKGEVL